MKYYAERFVKEIRKTELDLDFPFYNGKDDQRNEVLSPHHLISFAEAPSIEIDEVMNIMTKLKNEGADRVYIADHSDHHGYYFYGVKLNELK